MTSDATASFERFKRHFAATLKELSRKHGSINKVCADLKINRQQFAKYASGATLPSAFVVQRLVNYFKVDPGVFFIVRNSGRSLKDRTDELPDAASGLVDGFYLEYSIPHHAPDLVQVGLWRLERTADCLLCYGQLPDRHISGGLAAYSGVITALGAHCLLRAKSSNPDAVVILALSRLEFSTNDLLAVRVAADDVRGAIHEASSLFRFIGATVEVAEVLSGRCGIFERDSLDEASQAVVQILASRSRRRSLALSLPTPIPSSVAS